MPKVIKKKTAKPVKTEEGVKNVLHDTREFISEKQRILFPAAIALIIVSLAVAGFFIYRANIRNQAAVLEYEGYKLYYGLYQKQPLQKEERYQKALEKFRKAYDGEKSPVSLFYIAGCYYNLGKYDDAMKALRELNERFPDDEKFVPLSYYKMAMIALRKNDREGALKLLDTLYNYRTASFKDLALMESGLILEAMGRKEDAAKKYGELAKNFPGSPFVEEAKAKLADRKS